MDGGYNDLAPAIAGGEELDKELFALIKNSLDDSGHGVCRCGNTVLKEKDQDDMDSNLDAVPKFDVDPYKHLDHLGHGAYGYVDKVSKKEDQGDSCKVYARKVIRITSTWNQESQRQSVLNEFRILNRLKHLHIVKVFEVYEYRMRLSIVMDQVANTDLREFLQSTDMMEDDNPAKRGRRELLVQWPLCLIQGIDYLHEMKIKHKDLKPANILVMAERLLIADFGISKDVIDQETSASLTANPNLGTLVYCAPEVLAEGGRRGRASDIYSMGCVILEMSTVFASPKDSLRKWSLHRGQSGSQRYSGAGPQILQWIIHIWLNCWHVSRLDERGEHLGYWKFLTLGNAVVELIFLMLDPEPQTRITARQIIAFLQEEGNILSIHNSQSTGYCSCSLTPTASNPNLPLHSTFKPNWMIGGYCNGGFVLEHKVAPNWESAKRLFLESHMWW